MWHPTQLVLGHASIETFYKHYVLDEIPEDATEGLYKLRLLSKLRPMLLQKLLYL
jgi:hypothetical protein